jgi:hypothetical protein
MGTQHAVRQSEGLGLLITPERIGFRHQLVYFHTQKLCPVHLHVLPAPLFGFYVLFKKDARESAKGPSKKK